MDPEDLVVLVASTLSTLSNWGSGEAGGKVMDYSKKAPGFGKPVLPIPVGNLETGTETPWTPGLWWLDLTMNKLLRRTGNEAQSGVLGPSPGRAGCVHV